MKPSSKLGLEQAVAGGTFDPSEQERVGVLLLNLGGPEELGEVEPFLYNLFADPDIIRLPQYLQWLQEPLASLIAKRRAPKSRQGYASIGGGSPLRRTTTEQGHELAKALESKGKPSRVYVGMRYWRPFTEDALARLKEDGVTKLVVLPLYPQFSISTSGSSLRLLENKLRSDTQLSRLEHIVIPSWYQRKGYVRAMTRMIQTRLESNFSNPHEPVIFFSAHGVPKSYVEEAGDPYREEMEECVQLIMHELSGNGYTNPHVLAYQSRVGPVEWLTPYTDERLQDLGNDGVRSLLAVPISFVSEHIETLEEIDQEYRELAEQCGISEWDRVPALGTDPEFIHVRPCLCIHFFVLTLQLLFSWCCCREREMNGGEAQLQDLADAVIEALPYVNSMSPQTVGTSSLVPQGSVEDLLAAYDRERHVGFWASVEAWAGMQNAEPGANVR